MAMILRLVHGAKRILIEMHISLPREREKEGGRENQPERERGLKRDIWRKTSGLDYASKERSKCNFLFLLPDSV